MKRGVVLVLGIMLLGGCYTAKVPGAYWQKWEKDTPWGHVVVQQQRTEEGLCVIRIVELKREAGLYIDDNPLHLKAMDMGCDEKFDYYQTRDHRLIHLVQQYGQEVLAAFDGFMLFLMYSTIPIAEHSK